MKNIGNNCLISKDVTIPDNVLIGNNSVISKGVILYDNVEIGDNVTIGPYCIIGEPIMDYYNNNDHVFKKTKIGNNSIIRSHSVIYESTILGNNFQSGHRVTIREGSQIGEHCSVGTLSDLQGKLKIGDYVRLHSNVHIGQCTIIENYVWIYPYVVIANDPYPPMGKLEGATLREFSQVATSSIVMPGVEIGRNALVGAKTLVNKNVDEERVVVGTPCRDIGSVRDIRDGNGKQVYPWKDYLTEFRGYPWQSEND